MHSVLKSSIETLIELSLSFLKIGSLMFGGGYAMIPILEAEIVDKRGWATVEEILNYYAISQVTPGAIAINIAAFIGFKKGRYLGVFVATLSLITPAVLVILFLSFLISGSSSNVYVAKALRGINIAVVALLVNSLISMIRRTSNSLSGGLYTLIAFILAQFVGISVIYIIMVAAIIGYFVGRVKR